MTTTHANTKVTIAALTMLLVGVLTGISFGLSTEGICMKAILGITIFAWLSSMSAFISICKTKLGGK